MKEESLFFIRIKELCKKVVFTCSPLDGIQSIAQTMKGKNISGIIVAENGYPVGVITDRDFRNKIFAGGAPADGLQAKSIMTAPLITVKEDDYVFEAVYLMSKHNIHRLAVVDEMGMLKGVITDTDIIKYQTNTPLYFIRDLEYADSLDDLKKLNDKTIKLLHYLATSGVKIRDTVRFISHLNDSIILKTIEIINRENYIGVPKDFAFLVLGSEGRKEQTLKTDQDNAIVYADNMPENDVKALEDFSAKLIDAMIYIGVPECPGGIMAKNSQWRRSLSEWSEVLKTWISVPVPENTLNYSMFSDLRTIYGDEELEKKLKELIKKLISEHPLFLAHMARNTLGFPPPLGFFGRLKTEKTGEHRGKIDIKKGGIFPITNGIKVLSLENGILSGSTTERIDQLRELDVIPPDMLLEIQTSFTFLVQLRLKTQLNEVSKGQPPTNFVDPKELNHIEKERLKVGFYTVRSFLDFLKSKYNLNYIS